MKGKNANPARLLTTTILSALFMSASIFVPACGDDDPSQKIDIRGESVTLASEDIASALCHHMAQCGKITFECTGSCDLDNNCTNSCSGVIEPVTYDECMAEVQQNFQQMLECAEPTEEEQGQISACINDTVAQECLSQEQVDQMAVQMEQGSEVSNQPASCEPMHSIFDSCMRDDAQPGNR